MIQRLSAKRLSAAVLAALAVVAFSCERDPERDPALSESAAPEGELEPRPPAEGDGASPAAPAELDRVALGQTICPQRDSDQALAQNYVEGRYAFSPHPEVDLGTSLSWDEDPLEDNNWRFQLHTLRWLWPLVGATEQSGDTRYLEHAYSMARSWVRSNPFDDPAGDFAWNDHSTAWRTKVLGCLSMQGTPPEWLVDALVEHRDRLADPDFYVRYGNHALNQDGGLLVAACLTGDDDRRDLAMERIAVLAQESVDAEGVTDE